MLHPNRQVYMFVTPKWCYKQNPRGFLCSYQSNLLNIISLCFGFFINCQLEKLTECWPGDSHKNQQMATTFLRTSCRQQTIHLRIPQKSSENDMGMPNMNSMLLLVSMKMIIYIIPREYSTPSTYVLYVKKSTKSWRESEGERKKEKSLCKQQNMFVLWCAALRFECKGIHSAATIGFW